MLLIMFKSKFILLLLTGLYLLSCQPAAKQLKVNGQSYQIRTYGQATWMTENIRSTTTSNGDRLTYYFPNKEEKQANTYGLLYDYEAACKVCPTGWYLPTNEDWEALFDMDDPDIAIAFKDQTFWPGETNTNLRQFNLRPAGYGNNGEFDNAFGKNTYFWSKTKDNEHDVWVYVIEAGKNSIRKAPQHPTYAFSVRCVKGK